MVGPLWVVSQAIPGANGHYYFMRGMYVGGCMVLATANMYIPYLLACDVYFHCLHHLYMKYAYLY